MTDPCRMLDVVLTRSCNFQCDYCPIQTNEVAPGPDMGAVLKGVSAFLNAHMPFKPDEPVPHLCINIQGGEPLLRFGAVKMLVNAVNAVRASTGLIIDFTLKTNLLLLDEATLDYLNANKVNILATLDGCREAHDAYRSMNGVGTHELVVPAAKELLAKQPGALVQMAVTPQTIETYAESVKFLHDIGFRHIHPIFPSLEPIPSETFARLDIQVRKICDWWIGIVQSGGEVKISWIERMYRALKAGGPVGTCKPCTERMAIGPAGKVYPCFGFACAPISAWDLNNPKRTDRIEALFKGAEAAYVANRPPQCKDCEVRDYCIPSCYWRAAMTKHVSTCCGKGLRINPSDDFCQIQRIYFAEAVRAFRILKGEPVE